MHQLTEAGLSAMAEELLRLATDGLRSWDHASPQLRAEFRGYIDSMIDKARDAEEAREARPGRGVLP
jgi:hypothetical protein